MKFGQLVHWLSTLLSLGMAANVFPRTEECASEMDEWEQVYNDVPESPLVDCSMLDVRWIECEEVNRIAATNSSKVRRFSCSVCLFF